jgi:cysteinyl-tRNA synthetase
MARVRWSSLSGSVLAPLINIAIIALLWPPIQAIGPMSAAAVEMSSAREALRTARNWGYQLDNPDPHKLSTSGCDLLVTDYSRDGSDGGAFTHNDIALIHSSADDRQRTVLAYLSVGEAENYRFYWKRAWNKLATRPAWLGMENADWKGNFQVTYWDPAWQTIIYGSPDSYLDKIIAAGFDGVFLDRVDAYLFWEGRGHDAKRNMVEFVKAVAAYARDRNPNFVVVVQNGEELLEYADYLEIIDGVAKEDLFFGVNGSGRRNSQVETRTSADRLSAAPARGLPVFLVEYTSDPAKIVEIAARAAEFGFVVNIADRALKKAPDCNQQQSDG